MAQCNEQFGFLVKKGNGSTLLLCCGQKQRNTQECVVCHKYIPTPEELVLQKEIREKYKKEDIRQLKKMSKDFELFVNRREPFKISFNDAQLTHLFTMFKERYQAFEENLKFFETAFIPVLSTFSMLEWQSLYTSAFDKL